MVILSKIYTRTGDDGTTGLGTGARVSKSSPRIEAYGGVDELSAILGLCRLHARGAAGLQLRTIQNDLYDVGADLCVPGGSDETPGLRLRVTEAQVARIEKAIDRVNRRLRPIMSFVLPGGTPLAAWLHLARTVCRRAERSTVLLASEEALNPHVLHYLNRLSDLLFVLARDANGRGRKDVLWVPGGTPDGAAPRKPRRASARRRTSKRGPKR